MFKYDNNTLQESISELFVPNTANHILTCIILKINPNRATEYNIYTNFSFIGVHIWNDIQKHINISESYSAFKQLTRTYYLNSNLKYLLT